MLLGGPAPGHGCPHRASRSFGAQHAETVMWTQHLRVHQSNPTISLMPRADGL